VPPCLTLHILLIVPPRQFWVGNAAMTEPLGHQWEARSSSLAAASHGAAPEDCALQVQPGTS
jgi:hypothetical protein